MWKQKDHQSAHRSTLILMLCVWGNLPTVLKKPDRYLKTAAGKAMTKEWLTENFQQSLEWTKSVQEVQDRTTNLSDTKHYPIQKILGKTEITSNGKV